MPLIQSHPRWALACVCDLRPWAGKTIYYRAGRSAVTLPEANATGIQPGSHKYPDILTALTGHARGALLDALTLAGLPSPAVGIDEADKVWIESSVEFSVEITALGPTFGFTYAQESNEYETGRYRVVADSNWKRGLIQPGDGVRLSWSGTATNAWLTVHCQDVPTALRGRLSGDVEGKVWGSSGLSGADLAAGWGTRLVSWTVDANGHVIESALVASDLVTSWTSDGLSLRRALGFDGSEVIQASPLSGGGWRRAKHPCRWLLVPTRPLEAQTLSQEVIGSGGLLIGGGSTSVLVSSHKTWGFSGWIDGPHDTLGGDLTYHFLDGLAKHVAPGGRLRLFQNWGESRHAGRSYKGHVYGLERTVEMEGYRGVIQGCLSPSSEAQWTVDWPERIRRRSPVRFSLTEEEV